MFAIVKNRLNSGKACYHAIQNLLTHSLLSKNPKIKTYKIIILPVVLYRYHAFWKKSHVWGYL